MVFGLAQSLSQIRRFVIYSPRFADALQYAATVHQEQKRKKTQIPYIGHLLGAASIVIDAGGSEEEAIAALLHDAPEDQGGLARLNDIRERFGTRVACIIEGVSDPLDDEGKKDDDWEIRKAAYLEHLQQCGDASVYLVSAADKLHNARATLADVLSLGDTVWERFNVGRERTLANYCRLIAAYKDGPQDERRERIVRELEETVRALMREHIDERLYERLVELLDERDPMGLMAEGNPGREYTGEARLIAGVLENAQDVEDLTDKVHAVFVYQFDAHTAGPKERYRALAEELWGLRAAQPSFDTSG